MPVQDPVRDLTFALIALAGVVGGCERDHAEPNAFVRREGGAPPSPDARVAPPPAPRDGASAGPMGDAGPPGLPADRDCDLGGRWLVGQRVLATAVGQEQASHNWFYYEIRQDGAALLVTRGLHCGYRVVKKTSLGASVDSSGAWPAFLQHNSSAGRKGTYMKEGTGCRLELDREYTVRGATVAYYADPATKLPDRNQPASAGMPGWEDWDGDGNPGISLKVSSTVASGTLYTCQRDWTQYRGSTPARATKLRVAITYGGEQVALGRSPGSAQAITSTSSPSSSPAEHYALLHRLEPGQATGTDAEICAAIRALTEQLVPEANQ
jgi:hypothetical protein